MKKKLSFFLLTIMILSFVYPMMALAYSGGALDGTPAYLSNTNMLFDTSSITNASMTDDNESTYYNVPVYNTASGNTNNVWWQLSNPTTVSSYKFKGNSNSSFYLILYDSNKTQLAAYNFLDSSGVEKALASPVLNVSYVVLRNISTSITQNVIEFDVNVTPIDNTSPTVPTGLTATAGDQNVTLSWDANTTDSDIKEYEIYKDGVYVSSVQHPNTTFTVNGLTDGQTYNFQISAKDTTGNESANSTAVSATPEAVIPSVPVGLTTTPGDGKITLSWNANTDGITKEYEIYQDGVYVNSVQHPTTSFEISGLTNGTEYSFQISAKGFTGGESAKTAAATATPAIPPDTTPPADPTGLTANAGDGEITLSWTANAESDLAGYKVYRDGVYVGSTSTNSYTASNLTNGTSYSFEVSAIDSSGNESAKSQMVTATPETLPSSPTGLKTSISNEKVVLSWNAVTSATKYYVYRDDVKVQETTEAAYTDTGLTNGTQYKYEVSAVNDYGESPKSLAVFSKPADITDLSGLTLPFTVSDMIKTALNFLGLFPSWILLTLGIIFVPVLIFIVFRLVDRARTQKEYSPISKDARVSKREMEKVYREKISGNNQRYAGMTKEEWEKFKTEEIKRTNEYFERTGRVYEKRSDRPKPIRMVNEVRGRRKDGTLTARERKRIEERTQKHILKMRKEGR